MNTSNSESSADSLDLTTRRLVIAHNPHSSRAKLVEKQVFGRLNEADIDFETIEVEQAPLASNVARLRKEIKAGDIVICAAGDGSAHAVAHSVMAARKANVTLGFLAFGNFNDLPKSFNSRASQRDPIELLETAVEQTVRPLTLRVNKKPLRSALLYATAGWTASAAARFDDPKVRHKVKRGQAGVIKSVWRLGWYYLGSRRRSGLPTFRMNGEVQQNLSDVLMVNGPTLARLFKTGRQFYEKPTFFVRTLNVRWLIPNLPFLLGGLVGRMKGEDTERLTLKFDEPTDLIVQCDGEVMALEQVKTLEAGKTSLSLQVLNSRRR